jgi:hypothetical protein
MAIGTIIKIYVLFSCELRGGFGLSSERERVSLDLGRHQIGGMSFGRSSMRDWLLMLFPVGIYIF